MAVLGSELDLLCELSFSVAVFVKGCFFGFGKARAKQVTFQKRL